MSDYIVTVTTNDGYWDPGDSYWTDEGVWNAAMNGEKKPLDLRPRPSQWQVESFREASERPVLRVRDCRARTCDSCWTTIPSRSTAMTDRLEIEWAKWPWRRCRQRMVRDAKLVYWGRCDRRKGHDGKHALERGMDVVWFA